MEQRVVFIYWLTSAIALGEFDAEAVAVKVVVVTTANGVLGIPVVIKRDEGKCRRTSWCLQVDLSDLSVPVAAIQQNTTNIALTLAHKRQETFTRKTYL